MIKQNFYFPILILISIFFGSCGVHYVEIDGPSKKVEISCFSFVLPEEGTWYKLWTISDGTCENKNKFVSGNETDMYWIMFSSKVSSWKHDYNTEFLLEEAREFIESQRYALINHKDFKEYGIDSFSYELSEVKEVKDVAVKLKYSFSSYKPLVYTIGGVGSASPTTKFGENELSPSDFYLYELIEFHVIEGPYKAWLSNNAIKYKVIFVHISINDWNDPEFESTSLNFLKNLAITVDWENETSNIK